MMEQRSEVYNVDCVEYMRTLPNDYFDLACADPNYGIGIVANPVRQKHEKKDWDNKTPDKEFFDELFRVSKNQIIWGGNYFGLPPNKHFLIWDKMRVTGFLNANRMPMRCHEDICVFYKSLPIYNPQMEKCEPRQKNHRRHKTNGESSYTLTNRCYGKFNDVPDMITDEKFPTSIIRIPKEHIKGKSYHPTEKPVALLRYLIRTYSNEGDVILDNCMGSGTTCIAAIKEKRKYIGIEKEPMYFNIAQQRIANELLQQELF